ncbi:hypothetical protein PAXINDRAFT_8004 [Paxillus involutus ATCC 200175]|nr:hypothetical protein PAXINDRAFT_8004 [Paxillus involutus ATCC 200175]
MQHRATTHPITPARTQRPAHEGSIRPRAYPIRPGLSLSFTDPRVCPRTARSAHALVQPTMARAYLNNRAERQEASGSGLGVGGSREASGSKKVVDPKGKGKGTDDLKGKKWAVDEEVDMDIADEESDGDEEEQDGEGDVEIV